MKYCKECKYYDPFVGDRSLQWYGVGFCNRDLSEHLEDESCENWIEFEGFDENGEPRN